MTQDEIIGLDVGRRRIGVARGSLTARLAEPLPSIDTEMAKETLKELIKKYSAKMVVVGLPRGLDGQETDQTRWVRDWAESVKPRIGAEFFWQDEALTSRLADGQQAHAKNGIDQHSLAAAIILQDFLNSPAQRRMLI